MTRVLLAGFGGLGGGQDHQRAMYLPAFQAHPGFTVAGAVGADDLGVPSYPDLATALADDPAELVSVCLPPDQRAKAIVTALRAGRHVLADKPLALTAEEVDAVAAAAAESGTVCMPAHHQRFAPAVRSARAAVAAGRVGLPWNVQADFLVAGGDPCPLGELTNLGLYPIDVVAALVGQPVRRVHARAGGDVTLLLLDHDRGLTSTISVGRISGTADLRPGGLAVHRYRISGSNGVMNVDATKPGATLRTSTGVRSVWTGPDTVALMLTELRAAITGGRPAEVGPADALAAIRVVEAARRSLETGRPVPLSPDSQEGRQ
ncbi:Gfo/Idh/MocA family protein [Actinoallomurus iriomotensis]|uniref:NADH-dependent dehydrogenase n=1 Tax=Actinoallomurus iriomotensis TaxID=478107 RepID=A0A9W6S1Y2_9ACTN|nr:Gfo/Idh/MocA family oxidoreductase [Actinoallomurus iriomotensis]GLY87041.1 NADH-dependent dehydrogenase [Actinoallomurus iriomotensis]